VFSSLGNSLNKIFSKLTGRGYLSEEDIASAMREIKLALLSADVALPVVKQLIASIHEKAKGVQVIKSISPGQMVVKIVNDELAKLLSHDDQKLNLNAPSPAVIMMVGLQGAGKTTTAAKLALYLRQKHNKKVLLASLDVYRPAAQQQLASLGKQIAVDVLDIVATEKPNAITTRALKQANLGGYDLLILDTAGRLHTDETMMEELQEIKKISKPAEVILVADSLTGQDAVNIGRDFNEKIGITGIILTRVDGDARGGAALSMRVVTGKPIKFMGIGEKANELEEFHPERIASRILGMGDIVSLVEKAGEVIDKKEAEAIGKRLQKGVFDMNDLLSQLRNLKKLGGIGSVISMIPGLGKLKDKISAAQIDDKTFRHQEALILSMTMQERRDPKIINHARKQRIARGSGLTVQDVNRLLKQFLNMSKMVKQFGNMDSKKMHQLERMLRG
jgi:signal recognition particle subunit SRP54